MVLSGGEVGPAVEIDSQHLCHTMLVTAHPRLSLFVQQCLAVYLVVAEDEAAAVVAQVQQVVVVVWGLGEGPNLVCSYSTGSAAVAAAAVQLADDSLQQQLLQLLCPKGLADPPR